MTATRLRVVEQEGSILVLGTDQIKDAAVHLPPETWGWNGSFPGAFAKRQGEWRQSSSARAMPGVLFVGVKRS